MKKTEIRKLYLEKRKNLSNEEIERLSILISKHFFETIDLINVNTIHIFLPITKFKEVNTWHIIHKLWKEYPQIKTVTSITEKSKLTHVEFDKNTTFKEDNWGIPTPQNSNKIESKEIDLVVTPLLAFDSNNNRVGYGKGYYDRFFSECNFLVKKIGISLFSVLEGIIEDTNSFDIPLDEVITVTK